MRIRPITVKIIDASARRFFALAGGALAIGSDERFMTLELWRNERAKAMSARIGAKANMNRIEGQMRR
jgi:hypothetical protein